MRRRAFVLVVGLLAFTAAFGYYLFADAYKGQSAFKNQDFHAARWHLETAAARLKSVGLSNLALRYRHLLAQSHLALANEEAATREYRSIQNEHRPDSEANLVLALYDWKGANHEGARAALETATVSDISCGICRELHRTLNEQLQQIQVHQLEQARLADQMVRPVTCMALAGAQLGSSAVVPKSVSVTLLHLANRVGLSKRATDYFTHALALKANKESGANCREFADLFGFSKESWVTWTAGWVPHIPVAGSAASAATATSHFVELSGLAHNWGCAYEKEKKASKATEEYGKIHWTSLVQQVKLATLADKGVDGLRALDAQTPNSSWDLSRWGGCQ